MPNSFELKIDEKSRVASRFISKVRNEILRALGHEKSQRKITQQEIATKIGVNRSVVNRQLTGIENMTLRSVAELLWAIGWEPFFEARQPYIQQGTAVVYMPPMWAGRAPSRKIGTATEGTNIQIDGQR